ncbi:hypothetical protein V8C37DRAFT_398160 [Trichoderma ceciliae]
MLSHARCLDTSAPLSRQPWQMAEPHTLELGRSFSYRASASHHDFSSRPPEKRKTVEVRKATKSNSADVERYAIRIDEIPSSQSREALEGDLDSLKDSLIEEDPDLRDRLYFVLDHLVARDQTIACATATVEAPLSGNDLIGKLTKAGTRCPYRFDSHFQGITPLYEAPDGADVEYAHCTLP